MIKRKTLFNPGGNDDLSDRFLTKGNPTNLLNFAKIKYQWAWDIGDQMIKNNWEPQHVDLTGDKVSFNTALTPIEKEVYKSLLSFLVFLDSIQTQSIPRIAESFRAPEVISALTTHSYQENIHALSYQWIIENILPLENREGIYDRWREDKILFERNKKIANIFDDYWDKYLNKTLTDEDLLKVFLATYVLEGIYFNNGFIFFWNLASQQKMGGTSDMITYIAKDEKTHCVLFSNIINDFKKEVNLPNFESIAYEIFSLAVEQEIIFSTHLLGLNKVLGITEDSIDIYTKFLANSWLLRIRLKPLYTDEKYKKNPYNHLLGFSNQGSSAGMKENFFESTVTSYQKAASVGGWDSNAW